MFKVTIAGAAGISTTTNCLAGLWTIYCPILQMKSKLSVEWLVEQSLPDTIWTKDTVFQIGASYAQSMKAWFYENSF